MFAQFTVYFRLPFIAEGRILNSNLALLFAELVSAIISRDALMVVLQ